MKLSILLLVIILFAALDISAQTSAFTYQGRLTDASVPASGTYEMQFTLWDALTLGTQHGPTVTNSSVSVVNGDFTVQLDFTASPFATGANRWLEIAVKKPADSGFTPLTPRQPLTSNPFATRASSAASSDTASNAASLGGLAANTYLQANGDGSQLTNLNGANITPSTVSAAALAADTFPNNQNLSRLGQLRWDLLGQRVTVGTTPRGIAFDGANIWVANSDSNNVTKLRASDGAIQGTFPVGTTPIALCFDGENIWVVNNGSSSVTKLRASDGSNQGTFTVTGANGIAFDGANIWVTKGILNTVTKLRAADGASQGTFSVGSFPTRVAFDGANVWITNSNSSNVTKLRASDGAWQGNFSVGGGPKGVVFDGSNIWVVNSSNNSITKLRASDGGLVGTFSPGLGLSELAFDGTNLWLTNGSSLVLKLRASDASSLGTYPVGTNPAGVAFDGANIWVTNSSSNNVVKLPVFP
jgi:outer membrane lipoprotein-sorting protein